MKFPIQLRLPEKATRVLGKLIFKSKKVRPDICIIGGIILGTGAVVVGIVDTWKNKEEISNDINTIKQLKAGPEEAETQEALEVRKNDISKNRKKLAADLLKAYWKTAAMSGGSIILILSGRKLYRNQIIALSSMYASLLESYRRYRQNVIADVGAEKDQEYAYGVRTIEAIDAETGEIIKKTVVDEGRNISRYAKWLNEGVWDNKNHRWIWRNILYTPNKLELQARLNMIQNECNDILRRRGFMTLNQVYDKLSLPPTEEGQHVGWVRGGFVDGSAGDDFIDFGVFPNYCGGKYQLPVNRQFLDPRSNQACPLLDFNVICLDDIWNNIFEYDNRSMTAYEQRNHGGYAGSAESLDRWFQHADICGDM